LSGEGIRAYFVMASGTAVDFYGEVAEDIIATRGLTRFDNTQYSHYRRLRWLVLLREIFHLPFTVAALLRARRRWPRIDLIHVNEITEIIPGLIAKVLFRAPLVIHVRSAQCARRDTWRSRWINSRLARRADAIVAIDETVKATLPEDLRVDVVHNSFTASPNPEPDKAMLRRIRCLPATSLKVGFVGNLQVSKGIFELVRAAQSVLSTGSDVDFIIVGGFTRSDRSLKSLVLRAAGLAQNMQEELEELIAQCTVAPRFHLLGSTPDIQRVYDAMDVLCFPSHFDAPGRPIFEAAFSAVPCITCISDPKPDTVVPGETGLTVPARDPQALAAAIRHFADNRGEVRRMGMNALSLARANFEPTANACRLKSVYDRVTATCGLPLSVGRGVPPSGASGGGKP
jgi:glycosyltransferase involved in cell wall biosynthesis